jgi:hypothetical protein
MRSPTENPNPTAMLNCLTTSPSTNLRCVDAREAELRCRLRGRDMLLYTRLRYVSILEVVPKYVLSVARRACDFHACKRMLFHVNGYRTLSQFSIPDSALYRLERGGAVSYAQSAYSGTHICCSLPALLMWPRPCGPLVPKPPQSFVAVSANPAGRTGSPSICLRARDTSKQHNETLVGCVDIFIKCASGTGHDWSQVNRNRI